ncbi:STAS-like domain-containing protein [Fusobacterium animalis]|uniref:STAS-like domain-containing protein n=1 Tax=Fusobacterium animalis TaxID=76859 RepID=UPI0030D5EF25
MKRIIKVKDVINSKFAIKEDKGRILYKLLQESLGKNEKIILDFEDITASTTRFFNVSIAMLYKDFSKEVVENNIEIKNTNSVLNSQLEVSKNGAKEFYRIK